MLKNRLLVVLAFIVMTAGCATVHKPASQKQEPVLIGSMEEAQIGRGMAENIVKQKERPLGDPAKQLFLNRVGNKLFQVCDRKDIIYHFMILDDPDLNAFALPGGYVYITSGLFNRIDEPELAAVLAHEIGHVAAKHSVKKIQSVLGYDLLMGLALAGLGGKDPQLAQTISEVSDPVYDLLSRGYGREDELFADKLAVKYLRKAGYDPRGLVRVLEILNKEKGPRGRVFETLSDHPRMEERIKKAKEEIEKKPQE